MGGPKTLVGQIANLRRIGNPPARCGSEPVRVVLGPRPSACGQADCQSPQVNNLPRKPGSHCVSPNSDTHPVACSGTNPTDREPAMLTAIAAVSWRGGRHDGYRTSSWMGSETKVPSRLPEHFGPVLW